MKKQVNDQKLGLMVFKSARELGKKVDEHLLDMYNLDKDEYTFIVPIEEVFFEDGHLKVVVSETVRGKDMYFLTDIGNYSITYNMHGFVNHASPNDLMMQLKDGIHACDGHIGKINVIMPLLYSGRQHRRENREALSCGENLKDLGRIPKLSSIITFDVHDPSVEHAVSGIEFDNIYATCTILDSFIKNLSLEELKKVTFVSPDSGASKRKDEYIKAFDTPYVNREDEGFDKKRDLNNVVDGKNPIIAHRFSGDDNMQGKTAIIIDDMISSGGSLIKSIEELKDRHVEHVYAIVTYALFTKGIGEFDRLYREKKLDGVYTSNLSYIPDEYKKCEWLHVCDCSKQLASIIYRLHNDLSISDILGDRSEPIKLLERKFKGEL